MTTAPASVAPAPVEGLDLGTLNLMLEALGEFLAQELPESRMLELDHEDVSTSAWARRSSRRSWAATRS
jgi:hypothetical protein